MLGDKKRDFKAHASLTLDTLVPIDHFVRELEAKLKLDLVRDLLRDRYIHFGRPSIDPVVFFKLQLFIFLSGNCSERKLMEQVNMNLAYRWLLDMTWTNPFQPTVR